MEPIGATDYRNGARERLLEAYVLLKSEMFAGSAYLGGRAVEGMLRAVIWKADPDYGTGRKSLETGHDLAQLLRVARDLGVLQTQGMRESIPGHVQKVSRLWWNNMRYLPAAKVKTEWYNLKEIGGKRTMKVAAEDYFDACSDIIRRFEVLWQG